jgi:hypothetical protein
MAWNRSSRGNVSLTFPTEVDKVRSLGYGYVGKQVSFANQVDKGDDLYGWSKDGDKVAQMKVANTTMANRIYDRTARHRIIPTQLLSTPPFGVSHNKSNWDNLQGGSHEYQKKALELQTLREYFSNAISILRHNPKRIDLVPYVRKLNKDIIELERELGASNALVSLKGGGGDNGVAQATKYGAKWVKNRLMERGKELTALDNKQETAVLQEEPNISEIEAKKDDIEFKFESIIDELESGVLNRNTVKNLQNWAIQFYVSLPYYTNIKKLNQYRTILEQITRAYESGDQAQQNTALYNITDGAQFRDFFSKVARKIGSVIDEYIPFVNSSFKERTLRVKAIMKHIGEKKLIKVIEEIEIAEPEPEIEEEEVDFDDHVPNLPPPYMTQRQITQRQRELMDEGKDENTAIREIVAEWYPFIKYTPSALTSQSTIKKILVRKIAQYLQNLP